ncbi:TetR family transcriptional regulator [Rickettsiales endosymbiont of Stachyamoeba lipophora]|uniref:TetR family transcriptional regulator n=1 Tax=Rickettsiales endosymbiont of Stachyamoeba lipophora TaxID=2486578 RepID=UPI000F64B0BE|nr:TetR family transcriptional regulator [Rickettsiales endosymbiont of Stachyamoeba lipophora]AZL16071.1 TetR family transcriptional regulator [Rickettsiales endosymbiont of Stachyamoeba lipophora]
MVRRSKEEAEKTRALILDTAENIFLQKGVADTSLADIAKAAGVTRGAIYWHFKNKMDLFDAMHQRVSFPLDKLFDEMVSNHHSPMLALKEICTYCLQSLAEDEHMRRVYTILLFKCEQFAHDSKFKRHEQMRQEALSKMEKIFMLAQEKRECNLSFTPQGAALALYSFMQGIFYDYLFNPKRYSITSVSIELIDIFFKSFVAR